MALGMFLDFSSLENVVATFSSLSQHCSYGCQGSAFEVLWNHAADGTVSLSGPEGCAVQVADGGMEDEG